MDKKPRGAKAQVPSTPLSILKHQDRPSSAFRPAVEPSSLPTAHPHERNAVSTTNALFYSINDPLQKQMPKPPVPPSTKPVSVQSKASVNTTSTVNTASTSSSFDRISSDLNHHSWESATLSTAPSSQHPQSTESLLHIAGENRESFTLERNVSTSRRSIIPENTVQRRPSNGTNIVQQASESQTGGLPLPNSDYEVRPNVRHIIRLLKFSHCSDLLL